MPSRSLLLATVLVVTVSAFSPSAGASYSLRTNAAAAASTRVHPQPQMVLTNLASSINTILYATLGLVAGNGLVTKLPQLLDGTITAGVQIGDVAVDGVLAVVAVVQLGKMAGVIGKVDYAALEGLPKSFAYEAGERALAGEVSAMSKDGRYEVATFAGGCFWGTELHFQRIPGVVATCVGYTQGSVDAPTYEQVCSGTSGHTEATQLIYDPAITTYSELCETLFKTIAPDATALNRKGNDRGTQYRHGIYTHTTAQAEAAASVFASEQRMYGTEPIVTECKPATVFWPAEGYHQRYLEKGGQSAAKNARENVRCYG